MEQKSINGSIDAETARANYPYAKMCGFPDNPIHGGCLDYPYHLINEDMLKQCHKELDGNKAVGIDKVTKDEYGKNLDRNIKELVRRLKNKSIKPLPSLK